MEDLHLAVPSSAINYRQRYDVPLMGIECLPAARATLWKEDVVRIAEHHGVTVADILGPGRTRRESWPRFEVFKQLKNRGWSLPIIGRRIGGRDHTTVLSGIRRFDQLVALGKITPLIF